MGHALSLDWLSDIHGCKDDADYWGVSVDMGLSVKYMEDAANASGWDGWCGPVGSKPTKSVTPHTCQFALYKAYSTGYLHDVAGAVKENREKALSYLKMAAEGGHGEAKFRLFEYLSSQGDQKEARVWLERAANPEWVSREKLNPSGEREKLSDFKEFELEASKLLSQE